MLHFAKAALVTEPGAVATGSKHSTPTLTEPDGSDWIQALNNPDRQLQNRER